MGAIGITIKIQLYGTRYDLLASRPPLILNSYWRDWELLFRYLCHTNAFPINASQQLMKSLVTLSHKGYKH